MSKLNEATNRGGRPKNSLLDGLLQKCYHRSEPGKHLFRCVGSCGMTYVNRNLTRAVRHATGCHRLPAPIRIEAKSYAASKAPSRKLSADKSKSTKVNNAEVVLGKNSKESQVGTGVVALKKRFLSPVNPRPGRAYRPDNSGWRHRSSLSTNASKEACSPTLPPVEPIDQIATVSSGSREGGGG